ncbi:MAG: Ni/Fe-hydrogenase cytochrome b subunit [Dehalococcoidia bacterium]|nr:Ni/Fe-hydrogenase cytochrome b subunit [Dehalococcoidia bacterium]
MSVREQSLVRTLFTPGHLILLGLIGLGLVTAIVRYAYGIGAISNLSDDYPWGLWISFDLLCGVALAAGAFVTASAVYIFGREEFRPILRPAILTGFLGYLMVIFALLVDLGHPERIWYLIIFWNPHSVMFEVGWCVMLYTAVLAMEFSPLVWEKLQWSPLLRLIRNITVVLVILGTVLSTLHQSSLGSLFSIVPDNLNGLWYTPLLPAMFFFTAVAVGPAMVIFESVISGKVFKRALETDILGKLALAIPLAFAVYLPMKFIDIAVAGDADLLFKANLSSAIFWLEIIGGVVVPGALILLPSVRQSSGWLFGVATMVIAGVVLNRFNVSLIGLERPEGAFYLPHVLEFVITISIVSAGVLAYSLVARFLPLFPKEHLIQEGAAAQSGIRATSEATGTYVHLELEPENG